MRRKRAEKRYIAPDPVYKDLLVAKFINSLMYQGKKSTAEAIFYDSLALIETKTKNPGIDTFRKAMHNASPLIEVRARRVGGATYQVPTEVRSERRMALAIRWVINYSRTRTDKSMAGKLASEFLAAANGEGGAIKKKDDTHRMAEANKAFAHFRW